MSFEKLMAATHRLCASMDALAALGAELRVRQHRLSAPDNVRERLHEVIRCIEPDVLADVTDEQEATALAIIDSFFRQAADLLEHPDRPPGWSYRDPVVINGQGMTSRAFVRTFEAVAANVPDFKAVLGRPGTFLDVGTGAGLLAIEAARAWPAWKVVAIDRWEPALDLARKNIAASGTQDRIELRVQSVEKLEELETFSLAWLPGPFLPAQTVTTALERVKRALIPGGWLVFSRFSVGSERWSEPLTTLKVLRNGGYPWRQDELESTLSAAGFEQVGSYSTVGSTVTFGRRA